MGKRIIIPGADFSANKVSSYVYALGITDEEFYASESITATGTETNRYVFADQLQVFSNFVGSSIIGVKLRVAEAGNIPVYSAEFSSDTSQGTNFQLVKNLIVTQEMVDEIIVFYFDEPVYISNKTKLIFGNKDQWTLTGRFYYGGNVGDPNLCLFNTANPTWRVSTAPLCVDYIIE